MQWHSAGTWLLTAGRDTALKVYDVRMLQELRSFAGHGRDVTCAQWHPRVSGCFASGAADGGVLLWSVDSAGPVDEISGAHNSVLSLGWHPAGHVLATGGGDNAARFWARARPGELPKAANRWVARGYGGGGGQGGAGAGQDGGGGGGAGAGDSRGGGGRGYGRR